PGAQPAAPSRSESLSSGENRDDQLPDQGQVPLRDQGADGESEAVEEAARHPATRLATAGPQSLASAQRKAMQAVRKGVEQPENHDRKEDAAALGIEGTGAEGRSAILCGADRMDLSPEP